MKIFLTPVAHADLLLADTTSMRHNPTQPIYDVVVDFYFIRHLQMPNRNGQYLNMPM